MKKYMITGAMLCSAAAFAQYNPTVNVEGTYKPEVILQERINSYPERVRLGALESRIEFDLDGVVTDFTPAGVPMPATGWNDTRGAYPYRGYAGLALGSWLDNRLNAGYRFVARPNTLAGVYLRHDATLLWRPELGAGIEASRRRLTDDKLGLYVRHVAPGVGMLDADLRYRVAYFNYYGFAPQGTVTDRTDAPTQTLNNVDFHLLWRSDGARKFQYYAGVDVNYNGFRRYYTEMLRETYRGNRETIVTPRLGLEFGFGRSSAFGLDASGDIVIYNRAAHGQIAGTGPDNYGRISLTPYYKMEGENVYMYAGPRFDMIVNNGAFFRPAPDFRLGWHIRGLSMELTAGGGTEMNTIAGNVNETLYCAPFIYDARPVYVPFEGGLKFAFGPFAGFKAEISGTFRRAIGQHFAAGRYQTLLNGAAATAAQTLYGNSLDMYGVSMGFRLAYNYGRYFGIEAEATYQPQEGKKGYFNGWDLPEATARIAVRSNPWEPLRLGLDWNLRACRVDMRNWSSLDFRASYDILKNLRAELEVDNLLNRLHQEILPGLPSPGISARLGLVLQF